MIEDVLTEFVRGLGLADYRWSVSDGLAAIAFDRRGTLYLEERPEVLLIYLSRRFDARERLRERLCQALRLCHYRHNWPYAVQVGLRDESQLVFLARLPIREVTRPALEQTLELLTLLHERCEAAV